MTWVESDPIPITPQNQAQLADLKFSDIQVDPNNANVHYNLGLLYFDQKDYPKARAAAQRAYELGFALPGLKKMLESAGQWEPSASAPSSPGSGAAEARSAAPK